MEKKKSIVYDTSKGFSAFVKLHFADKISIYCCGARKKLKAVNSADFEICFFVVNDIDDIFILKEFYFLIEHFFITSPKEVLMKKVESLKLDEIILIDFNSSKKDMYAQINSRLALIS
jgi:hypothetical protein